MLEEINSQSILNNRSNKIDLLRSIGTLLVVLAHVNPPSWIINLRSFDVILLVFTSGLSINFSRRKNLQSIVKGRVRKLIIPSYLLSLFLIGAQLLSGSLSISSIDSLIRLLSDVFLFFEGVGYVWIVRIYLVIALLTPSIIKVESKVKDDVHLCTLIISSFILLMYISGFNFSFKGSKLIDVYLIQSFAYVIVALIGLRSYKSEKFANYILIIFGLILLRFFVTHFQIDPINWFVPNNYKYPPTMYYLSYGIFLSLLLFKLIPEKIDLPRIVSWISDRSFNIYLVHVIVIYLIRFVTRITSLSQILTWEIEYLIVLSLTLVIVSFATRITNITRKKVII